MKILRMELNVSNLGEQTHIWFPAPQGKFSITPTAIQTDKKYGNKIAYFYNESPWRPPRRLLNTIHITANFPILSIKNLMNNRASKNYQRWLNPNRFVQSDDKTIIHLAENLTQNHNSDEDKTRPCFDFVVGYLTYANPIRGLYSSLQALTEREVDCGGFSTLLVALLRAIKIPARCVFGWAIQSKHGYHAWVEYFDRQKQKWISLDPSVAHLGQRTKLNAGFGFINDERVILSIGEDIQLGGNDGFTWSTPLLQSPVVVTTDSHEIPLIPKEKLIWRVV